MPRWGRPPGAPTGRTKRGLVGQLEQSAAAATQDLDRSDNDGDDHESGEKTQWQRQWQRQQEQNYYATTPSDEDGSDEGEEYGLRTAYSDPTMAYAVQLAMQDDDEWLVENALDKIRRSHRLGKPAVRLSQRELGALERSRLQSERGGSIPTASTAGSRRVSAASSPGYYYYTRPTSDAPFAHSSARPPSSPTLQQPRPRAPSTQQPQPMHPPHSPSLDSQYPHPYAQPLNHAEPTAASRPPSSASSATIHPSVPPPWWPRSSASSSSSMPPPPPPLPLPPLPPPGSPYYPGAPFLPYDPHYTSTIHHPMATPPPAPESTCQLMCPGHPAASSPDAPQPAHTEPSSPRRRTGRSNSSGSNNSDNGVPVSSSNGDSTTTDTPAGSSAPTATSEKSTQKKRQPTKTGQTAASNGNVVGRRKRKTSGR